MYPKDRNLLRKTRSFLGKSEKVQDTYWVQLQWARIGGGAWGGAWWDFRSGVVPVPRMSCDLAHRDLCRSPKVRE